jgi:SAM-dependent methyltransferase
VTTRLAFAATIFTGATLLFACQPMVARMIVPLLGGAPAVWIVCSLCFQTLLLAGYGYAHFVGTRAPFKVQVVMQLALVGAVFVVLPIAVDSEVVQRLTREHPTLGLLQILLRSIGLPFFALSTSSPLLQRWFAELGESDPYHLYAASNAGSMMALLGYPLLVEPLLSVRAQSRAFHTLFAAYAVLVVVCATAVVRRPSRPEIDPAPPSATPASWRDRATWIGLSFAPSSLLLGTTEYVTTDIASVPLLWVLPLSLYLLSFILAFSKTRIVGATATSTALAILALAAAVLSIGGVYGPAWLVGAVHLALLFVASVVCHTRLAEMRPGVTRLTEFYLLMSIGGVLGGAFNGLVAPVVFHDLYEYPIAIGLVCIARASRSRTRTLVFAMLVGLALFISMAIGVQRGRIVLAHRGFYGIIKVVEDAQYRYLVAGRSIEGLQDPARPEVPLAHVHPNGPAGQILGPLGARDLEPRRIGVVGLGIGSLLAYARTNDEWTFFEMNPAVVDVARRQFTYLAQAERVASIKIEVGDARLRLREGEPARFDVLVLDALSSDAVPVHLVTREAVAVYRRALRPGGLILAHVSNDHVRLSPVLGALAKDAGMIALDRLDEAGEWVLLTDTKAELDRIVRTSNRWRPAPVGPSVWTDDFANVLGAMRF